MHFFHFFREKLHIQKKLNEANKEISDLKRQQKDFKKYEEKYLKRLNEQNTNLHLLKKMFNKQAEKNVVLHKANTKLNQRLAFYINNEKVNQDEVDDLIKEGLVNNKLAADVDNWLQLKEGTVDQVKKRIFNCFNFSSFFEILNFLEFFKIFVFFPNFEINKKI